jgi:hypothetical protein
VTAAHLESLDDARSLVRGKSSGLDPGSRYIRELGELVDAAKDLADLEARLDRGCRGKLHAGDDTWSRMTLEEKLLANLVTNETELLRFDPSELSYLQGEIFPWLGRTSGRVASIPCSHGLEPVSVAVELLSAGVEWFHVHGFDVQRACIETAMTGRIPVAGLPRFVVAVVDPKVMNHLSFHVLDALQDAIPGRYDLILCRNFLGYFRPELARAVVEKLVAVLDRPGCLLVERFITRKHPAIFDGLGVERAGDVPAFWKK